MARVRLPRRETCNPEWVENGAVLSDSAGDSRCRRDFGPDMELVPTHLESRLPCWAPLRSTLK
jgi:hypothetical protein